MQFANPYLFFLAIPALAAAWAAFTFLDRRRASLRFSKSHILVQLGSSPFTPLKRYAQPFFLVLAILLMITALARPQKVLQQAHSLSAGIDILLVLDTSTSMRALDFAPLDRMTAAKEGAKHFIQDRIQDRMGLLVFGGVPILACPPTMDYNSLLEFLGEVETGMTHSEGTAIGDALAAGVHHLRQSGAKSRVLVLLTDGRSNTGIVDPITAARAAGAHSIKIYTIGTAMRGEALYPVEDPIRGRVLARIQEDLDEDSLREIARATGGRYFRATNFVELAEIYKEIDSMEKTKIQPPRITSSQDLYGYFLWPALLLLVLEIVLGNTVLLRVP